ncbi:MAG TPA: TM2 domain-containing protein [Propionibacteriaceae bacterium]|nr:TM2 domain-containing protein [Propionibacteriaceae bacterium]
MAQPPAENERTPPYHQPPSYDVYGAAQSEPYGYPPSHPVQPYGMPYQPQYPMDLRQQAYPAGLQKSRLAAGLLAIFLGGFGIHNFYLGRTGIGVVQLLLTVLSFGFLAPLVWIWVIVEAILILTRSPGYATDAKGIPLRD